MQRSETLTSPSPGKYLHKTRLYWIAFGAAAIAALAISFGAYLWINRDAELAATRQTSEKLAIALAEHSRAVFETVDSALRLTASQLNEAAQRGETDPAVLHAIVARNAAGHTVIHSMSLRNVRGQLSYLSLLMDPPMNDTSTSDYFVAHRDADDDASFIGAPVSSVVTGEFMIPVSRRLNDAHGAFAGVVVAAIPLRFFSEFFRSLQVGEHGIVTLLRTDGIALVRDPPVGKMIGARVVGSPLFTKYLQEAPTGVIRLTSLTDQVDRIFAYRQVPNLPLVVSIGIAVDDALAEWYRDLRVYLAIWLVCATALLIITGVMLRLARRQEQSEQAAGDANDRFRRFVANVPGGVFQRTLSRDGAISYSFLSSNAKRMFGYPAEAAIENATILVSAIHPDDRAAFESMLHDSARDLSTMSVEHRINQPDGSVRWVQTVSTPTRQPNGDVVWDGLVIDITDRKRMEIALQRSEAEAAKSRRLLTDAFESINGGFVLYDADDRLVLMNRVARDWHPDFAAAAVPGATHAELIRAAARTGRIVGAGQDIEEMVQHRLTMHRQAFGQPIERRVDGRWYQITEYPTNDGGVVVLRTDVTALKEANLRLEDARLLADHASRAKSDFLAMMSHELRTPLNAVLGFSEIIRDHGAALTPEKLTEYATDVHTSGSLLLTLINDVLDLTKAESGKMELNAEPLDVEAVVRRSVRIVQERALRQGVDLIEEIAPELPQLWADERKLTQILLNLLSNAVKFTPAGGRVTVAVSGERADLLTIRISDTGIGIAPENLDKALAAFGQVDNLLTRQHEGTGLGLPLAKRLAELHGARFELNSEVGRGTTVVLRFPLKPNAAAA